MKRALMAWAGVFLLLFSMGHGNIENLDGAATMHAARALWHRGDSGLRSHEQGAEWLAEQALVAEVRLRASRGDVWYGKVGENDLVYVWFPMAHVWLMVPPVILGDALHAAFPSVEEAFRHKASPGVSEAALTTSRPYLEGQFVFIHAFAAIWPALFGATSVLLLFLLARALGAAARDALVSTAAIALATQFFPLTRESLSDGPGMCFLLAAMLATVRSHLGEASRAVMLFGGLAAGFAVLSRYAHGTLVPFLGLAIALSCWRRRMWADLVWFAVGGLPCLVLLLTVNYLRHGDVSETGYPQASSWFNYPIWFGAIKILFAAGKGILWFSPLLWLLLPALVRRRADVQLRWLAWVVFLVPLAMFSSTPGWQSGQCWGVRYVTPGIVCLLAIGVPQLLPWKKHRMFFALLVVIGLLVNITGVIAPTRAYNQLAGQAVLAAYQRQFDAGEITADDWKSVQEDQANRFFFELRFSPLHANWTYALRSWRGEFENEQGLPVNGGANTIEPLFGIEAVTPAQGIGPVHWEDRGGRHLWWVFWGRLLGIGPWLLLLPVLVSGAILLRMGWPERRKTQQP